MFTKLGVFQKTAFGVSLMFPVAGMLVYSPAAVAQAPAAARQIGTVKVISGNSVTLATDAAQQVTVSVADGAKVLQLEPGSTDLKTAKAIALSDVAVGDRILVTGTAGDAPNTFSATRVILMKSTDIAQKHVAEQADWQKRGTGGLVTAIDAGSGTLTVTAGAKKIEVKTSGSTQFRRYAGDSVKFEDAKPGTMAEIQVGDQLRVRGAKSDDGSSMQAEEIVSGSFKNLAGTIATIDAANGSLTLKDLATKKTMTVKVTANSSVHNLPPRAAAMFAARARGGAAASGDAGSAPAPQGDAPARGAGGMGNGGGGRAGGDLSQMVNRLPAATIADLKTGDAVMIVASEPAPGSTTVTAVTLLSGVEPILAANPSGSPAMTLSPWSIGGGAPDGGIQ
jgi:co-chaperonin GroES (HSP10)